jgi:hypothetical protein
MIKQTMAMAVAKHVTWRTRVAVDEMNLAKVKSYIGLADFRRNPAMYCPKCSQPSTSDQKFCRHCGLSLKEVAPLVAETAEAEKVRLEKHLTKVVGWGVVFFFLWFLILASMDIPGLPRILKEIAGWLGIVSLGLGIVLSLYAGTRWWWLWQFGVSANRRQARLAELLPEKPTTELLQEDKPEKLLSESQLPVPSVTEGPTELLMVERRGKRREG